MRFCFFSDDRLGLVEGQAVRDVTAALNALPAARYPYPTHDVFIAGLSSIIERIRMIPDDGERLSLASVSLQCPVRNPGKLIAAPVNYTAHLKEAIADETTFSRAHVQRIQDTGLFLKATSSLIGSGSTIEVRQTGRRTDHEIELAVVIGSAGRDIARWRALEHVAGYCIGLDITMRGPEERSLRKSVDTYSVIGPWLVTADEFGDPAGRGVQLCVNGEARQLANTRDLILDVPALIAFASGFYTLHPGDVIFTGTPAGVGPIFAGDVIEAAIEGLGEFSIEVREG
jgi:2-keto-4-pentenoate hydratase/2-oxohepta-3-ene-1,7-dioic acid hydratase in catechol pathway